MSHVTGPARRLLTGASEMAGGLMPDRGLLRSPTTVIRCWGEGVSSAFRFSDCLGLLGVELELSEDGEECGGGDRGVSVTRVEPDFGV